MDADSNGESDFLLFSQFGESQYTTREEILERRANLNNTTAGNTSLFKQQKSNASSKSPVFLCKGSFYGLPAKVETMIRELKNIHSLYDWQKECLEFPAIQKRHNLIYSLPTSGGKTLVAEILMLREIICWEKNVMLILPYVSIVQEKVSAMGPFAYNLDFLIEEYAAGRGCCPPVKHRKRRTIYICSIEKGAILLDSLIQASRADEVGLLVVDELHLIGAEERGAILEGLLLKAKSLKNGLQIIGMSATIGNIIELSDFLNADVYTRGFRPVELKEFIKCGRDVFRINSNRCSLEELFTFDRTVKYKYTPSVAKNDPDHLAGLVSEVIPTGSCLVFCSSKKNCENVAALLAKILQKKSCDEKKDERLALIDAIEKLCGSVTSVLKITIPYGIAYHHSGLTHEERKLLESGFRQGTLCVICCTSTLAAGVNLPANRVIIRAPYIGRSFMTLSQYKQMVGRAGRAGLKDAGESILICSSNDNLKVGQMLLSPMDEVNSAMLHNDSAGIRNLVLSAIALKLAESVKDLLNFFEGTLLSIQLFKLNVTIETEVIKVLRSMFHYKIITVMENDGKLIKDAINISVSDEASKVNLDQSSSIGKSLILSRRSKFKLTSIGNAAFKAGIDFRSADMIFKQLKTAQLSLTLVNFAHLLYLVFCVGFIDDRINIDTTVLFHEYSHLDHSTLLVAKKIGITEAFMVKIAKTNSTIGPLEKQLNRFYKVLILTDLMNVLPVHNVADKYKCDRGTIQILLNHTMSATSSIIRFCEQIEELWCYASLFQALIRKLDCRSTTDLTQLLELPCVQINRAKQIYKAGYKTIEDVARAKPSELSEKIEHLSFRVAHEIVAAAKIMLLSKLESLQEETETIFQILV